MEAKRELAQGGLVGPELPTCYCSSCTRLGLQWRRLLKGHNTFLFSPWHEALREAGTNSYDKLQNRWRKCWQCWHLAQWENSQEVCDQAPLLSWLSWWIPELTRKSQWPRLHWHNSRSWQLPLHSWSTFSKSSTPLNQKAEDWTLLKVL